ncbi:MAG: hypothetical protein FJ253_09270 [Phycisphaerae bacterium]|nr:hypothetical protein [Phycisphaerae bacterium]
MRAGASPGLASLRRFAQSPRAACRIPIRAGAADLLIAERFGSAWLRIVSIVRLLLAAERVRSEPAREILESLTEQFPLHGRLLRGLLLSRRHRG